MADVNRVLEAEQAIQDIASELAKMKEAADLLVSAQDKTNRVIATSNAIITKVGEFVGKGSEIVNRIGDYDIQNDLSQLHNQGKELSSFIEIKIQEVTTQIKDNADSILERLNSAQSDIQKALGNLENLERSIERIESKARKVVYVLMGLIGINVVITVVTMLKSLDVF